MKGWCTLLYCFLIYLATWRAAKLGIFTHFTFTNLHQCSQSINSLIYVDSISPRNSPRQSAIAEGFAEANSTFIVITSAKILPRWLFLSKIYIHFTIFNIYFSTKLLFTNKRYHLHVLEKSLNVLQEVRSIIYSWISVSGTPDKWNFY